MSDELQIVPQQPLPVAAQQQSLSIEQVADAVMKGNISREHVQVMKELLAMDAERKFAVAFVALQSSLPVIVANTTIPNRGKYEKFEDVMKVVGPLLQKHGFTVSFSQDFKENRILETCTLTHIGGHSRNNTFAVRASGKSDSETQADCKASTTAKRNALLNCLNIVIRQDCMIDEDNDASIEGGFISKEQAADLERRVKETGSDVTRFLKFANAKTFGEILSGRYAELDASLRKKESTK